MDVRTLSLGVLTHGPMTGYEIKKVLEENFRHFVSASYGSIYPALAELAAAGHVTVAAVEQDKRPHKKVYELTEAGRARLVADLMATEARHRVRSEFLVLMYFAHLLPPAKVDRALGDIVASWERWLHEGIAQAEESQTGPNGSPLEPGMRFALGYGRVVLGAVLDYVKGEGGTLLRELEARQRRPPAEVAEKPARPMRAAE
jgi:PadR family transcriptional regulator, regulatory protein AphA